MMQYFESDDPDLYTTKIKYILENDATDLGLVFTEEEFDDRQDPPNLRVCIFVRSLKYLHLPLYLLCIGDPPS